MVGAALKMAIAASLLSTSGVAGAGSAGRQPARVAAEGRARVSRARPSVRFLRVPTTEDVGPEALLGRTVVFDGQSPGKGCGGGDEMWSGRLRHWRPKRLFCAGYRQQLFNWIRISKRWLVWEAYSANTTWDIYARNWKTHRRYMIDTSYWEGLPPAQYDLPGLSLFGNTLAWSYFKCLARCRSAKPKYASFIALRSLPNGRRRVVWRTNHPCDSIWPSLWGTVLVWDQEGRCGGHVGTDVLMMNLKSHHLTHITTNHGGSEGVTNGRYVAWKQGKPGSSRFQLGTIGLLDLKTGKRRLLSAAIKGTSRCYPSGNPPGTTRQVCAEAPVIDRDVVAWNSEGSPWDMVAMDLRRRKEYDVFHSNQTHIPDPLGAPSGRRLIWADLYTKPSPQIHELAVGTVP